MSVKSLDKEGRWRNVTIAFRVSDEENERLNQLVAISGMTKQAFILSKLEDRRITVLPTIRVQKSLSAQARRLADELSRIAGGGEVNARQIEISEAILDVLEQMREGGMTAGSDEAPASVIDAEMSDMRATMRPEMRQIPLKPDEIAPATGPDRAKPPAKRKHRKATKGMFKKESR